MVAAPAGPAGGAGGRGRRSGKEAVRAAGMEYMWERERRADWRVQTVEYHEKVPFLLPNMSNKCIKPENRLSPFNLQHPSPTWSWTW